MAAQQQQQQRLDVVPDSLLALAKDTRYVRECHQLFLQVLSSLLPRRQHQLLEQESWILASLLCLALGLKHTSKGTSLGMETLGLQFGNSARWKLVASTLVTLSWAYAFSPARRSSTAIATTTTTAAAAEDSIGNDNNSNHHHRDGLRSSLPLSSSSPSSLMMEQPQHNDEMLRGSSRREYHERQRQAMLRRANQAAAAGNRRLSRSVIGETATTDYLPENQRQHDDASAAAPNSNGEPRDRIIAKLRRRIKAVALCVAQILASATLSPFEGPHTLAAETQQQRQQQQSQQQQHYVSVQQAGRWLAKLQLAHFCLTGMYPTWMHRFCGHALVAGGGGSPRLYHRPTTARLVGLMLGAQALAALIQASSAALSQWIVRREQRRQQGGALLMSSSSSVSAGRPPIPPAVIFHPPPTDTDSGSSKQATAGNSNSICSICKMERTHPAAPTACGHVFCWRCLIQWVSAIRPECPLCRASCRPQDILALYNYSPTR